MSHKKFISETDPIHNGSSVTNNLFYMGLAGVFVLAHGAIILSLPPVIQGKGAPFLPTSGANMDLMFKLIKIQPQIQQKMLSTSTSHRLKFVDLGSGDGRMVFRSAREPNLFKYNIGYEINPGTLYRLFVMQV